MAKKRVEENVTVENITIDDSMNAIPMQPVEMPSKKTVEEVPAQRLNDYREAVSCLRNERIIVRYVAHPTSMVTDKRHILYGGMAENAKRSFVVPKLVSSGIYKNVLTDNEKNFLEQAMGLEYNALSIYRKKDNFWDDSNPNGIGRVTLHKQDNYLDLSIPEDFIKYKILLANKDKIASSLQELEEHPKETYQFVIISENAVSSSNLNKMDATMQCYTEYGAIRNDLDTLRVLIELSEGRPLTSKVKLDFLQNKVNEYIQKDPRKFLTIITDELLPLKVLIRKSVEAGLIGKKNNTYYLREDGSPLCEMGEESTLNNAAKFIGSVKHQELKYMLEAKVKEANK